MARLSYVALGMLAGFALGTFVVASHADPVEAEVEVAAAQAGVSVVDLMGAVNTTQLDPFTYLRAVGELPPLPHDPPLRLVANPPPVANALAARVACIESKESGGANVANARGSGAGGVLQFMPGTFAAHAAEMGHPEWSLWNPGQARAVAAHDLALGRRSQWTVGGC